MTGTLIVTGFGPFGDAADNPSQRVVERLAQVPSPMPQGTQFELLDVEYGKVGAWLDALLQDPPDALMLTGFSASATGLTLESRATCAFAPDQPDNAGHIPEAEPEGVYDNDHLDLAAMQRDLAAAGLPASVSCDAGAYLCNFSYRKALTAIAERRLGLRALFVHLPAIAGTGLAETSAGAMTLDDMASGLSIIGKAMLGKA